MLAHPQAKKVRSRPFIRAVQAKVRADSSALAESWLLAMQLEAPPNIFLEAHSRKLQRFFVLKRLVTMDCKRPYLSEGAPLGHLGSTQKPDQPASHFSRHTEGKQPILLMLLQDKVVHQAFAQHVLACHTGMAAGCRASSSDGLYASRKSECRPANSIRTSGQSSFDQPDS